MNKSLFSSKKDDWETPQELFEELDQEFNFTLDPCSSEYNHKCKKYYTLNENGLIQNWSNDIVFMNPPYGRKIGKWVEKAYNSNTTVVCLLPSRTDTKWFHDFLYNKSNVELRFLKGRIKFSNCEYGAPFPSLIAIINNKESN